MATVGGGADLPRPIIDTEAFLLGNTLVAQPASVAMIALAMINRAMCIRFAFGGTGGAGGGTARDGGARNDGFGGGGALNGGGCGCASTDAGGSTAWLGLIALGLIMLQRRPRSLRSKARVLR